MSLCDWYQTYCGHQQRLNNDDELLIESRYHQNNGKDYESLDYDKCYNKPYRKLHQELNQKHGKWYNRRKEFLSWLSIFVIGFLTALVAFFIDSIIKLLTNWKLTTVIRSMQNCEDWSCIPVSLFELIGFNLFFVGIAAFLVVFGEPLAAGSGIPEIKCYLNGVKVRHVTRFWTLICKAVGVLFSVSGGLLVGKEGPMIHSGGVIGAGVPQFESLTFKKLKLKVPYFRSDRDKRDFVSAGAAAGVAAAFGAPIGGVLFSLEEGCSFWSQALTWKTLFCTMTSTFTLNFFLSGTEDKSWGSFSQNGLLTFGVFECPEGNKSCHLWTALDLFIFILIGFGGGLFGMLFNFINTRITLFRIHYLFKKSKLVRFFEALLVGLVTTLVVFLSPLWIGQCKPIGPAPPANVSLVISSLMTSTDDKVQPFLCPNGTYNDMATLFFNGQETAIKQLFHHSGEFSLLTLGVFFILFFLVSCWTYGSCVPSGLFVPCILCGAAYGRFVATLLHSYFGMEHIYLGTFSLIGAAAFLGGVVRMTISLTVILIECTNEITLSLPIMVTLMVAKWAGDLGNSGLYDIHIKLKSVPLLEWEAPHFAVNYTAKDIMNTRLSFVYPNTYIRSLINLLSTTAHHAFPVVTRSTHEPPEEGSSPVNMSLASANMRYRALNKSKTQKVLGIPGDLTREVQGSAKSSSHVTRMQIESERNFEPRELRSVSPDNEDKEMLHSSSSQDSFASLEDKLRPLTFHGMILRNHLVSLIKRNICYSLEDGPNMQQNLSFETLNEDYPRFPTVHDLNLQGMNPKHIINVAPYMHPCPHVAHPDSPVPQVFNLFRTMGLRHLPVINSAGELLGLITRHNLTHEFMEEIHEKKEREEHSA